MDADAKKYLDELMERHIPGAFLDYEVFIQMKQLVLCLDQPGRKELLIIAYIIGATAEESNNLLIMLGHSPLYVKNREDAIWRFMLNHRSDSTSIINEIFLQNVDEKGFGKCYK